MEHVPSFLYSIFRQYANSSHFNSDCMCLIGKFHNAAIHLCYRQFHSRTNLIQVHCDMKLQNLWRKSQLYLRIFKFCSHICNDDADIRKARFSSLFWLSSQWTFHRVIFIALQLNETTFHRDLLYVWDSNVQLSAVKMYSFFAHSGCAEERNLLMTTSYEWELPKLVVIWIHEL